MDGDREKDKALIAETIKLIRNSSYGKLITNKEKHHDIVYVNESEIGAEIMDNHFYSLTELPNSYYEVEKTKQKIILDLPIHLSVFILNYAKLCMLEFDYNCVNKYLSREDFEYSEMDMDSAYMAISGDSFESLIKPDLREEFENDKQERQKENVLMDFSRSNSRETRSLVFAVSRIVLNVMQLKIQPVKSSSL